METLKGISIYSGAEALGKQEQSNKDFFQIAVVRLFSITLIIRVNSFGK
jgi:hypothetical protein